MGSTANAGPIVDSQVIVVGGGPVGLTTALDLAWRGIEVVVLEQRLRSEPPPPKCNHVSARSMEIFRRLGVAGKLRNAGLPADYPNDVSYRTTFTGTELTRIVIPCRRDRYDATKGADVGWPTPEPPHRINQIYLEPILANHAEQSPRITILWGTEFTHAHETPDGVVATGVERDGSPVTISGSYLVGSDGGSSAVRKLIGAEFEGDPVLQRSQTTFFRAPDLLERADQPPAWATFSLNPRRSGNVYAIDGRELFVVHNYLRPDETDFDSVDRDACLRTILGVGNDFSYEILGTADWFGRRLVADRFRSGRMFLAGDSAHIWVPYGGYGMNAGIADATNLSWLLAAHLNGWGSTAILDAYEAERKPITEQVSHYVMRHSEAMARQRGTVPGEIEDDSAEGATARAELGEQAYELNVQQYCAAGLNFGSFYDDSPIIEHDNDEEAPGYSMADFTPSTVPGCRTPHVFLTDGTSVYDLLGPEYTLLRFDPAIDVEPIVTAAQTQGLPLVLVDVDPELLDPNGADVAALYAVTPLVISRPDQHLAWRGSAAPADPATLVSTLAGHG